MAGGDQYLVSGPDHATLARVIAWWRAQVRNNGDAGPAAWTSGRPPVFRIAKPYQGEVPAATYDGDAITAMGKGEGKLQTFNTDGTLAEPDADSDPVIIYNPARQAIPEDATMLVARDQTITGEEENVSYPGWVAIPLTVTQNQPRILIRISNGSGQSIADNDTDQEILVDSVSNFDTSVFEKDGDSIRLARAGKYRLHYNLSMEPATGQGSVIEEDAFISGDTLEICYVEWQAFEGAWTPIVGTQEHLRAGSNDAGGPRVYAPNTWYYTRPPIAEEAQVDLRLIARRVLYDEGMRLMTGTAEIVYLGDIDDPVGV